MKRRIALVIGQLGRGGAELQLTLAAEGLRRAGEAVEVFCLSDLVEPYGPRLSAAGIPVTAIARRGRNEPLRAIRLASLLRSHQITLVISFLESATIYSYLASLFYRIPLMPSLRSLPVRTSLVERFLLGRALRTAPLVIANSEQGAAGYRERYLPDGGAVAVIHNGVETQPAVSEAERSAARAFFGLSRNRTVVGTVSKDDPDKNVPAFLRLTAALNDREGGICTMLAGRGLDESYAVRQGVVRQKMCDSYFLGELEDMRPFYSSLDLLVVTSLREGMPNVVLEAQALGVPAVAFDVGGMREVIEHGRTGMLAPAGDEAALLELTKKLLDQPEKLKMMGLEAREETEKKFAVGKMVEATLEACSRVLDRD